MAGIGFELKRILKEGSLISIIKVYSFSTILSAGPWLASILAISIVGYISQDFSNTAATKFQISVTYLFAFSLIFSSLFQLPLVRYVADRIYEKDNARIIPNLGGALILIMGGGMLFMLPLAGYIFREETVIFMILFISSFVTLCGIWLGNLLLTGLRMYRTIMSLYVISYGLMIALALLLRKFGMEGLLASFFCGSVLLFCGIISILYINYPTDRLIEFDFLSKGKFFYSLCAIGLLYNIGIWADKFIFWFHPLTGYEVVGKLRASTIYDLPIFLAYLLMTPGIAMFFYRYETDFMSKYALTGVAINQGGTFSDIEKYKQQMVDVIRTAIMDVLIIQGIINVLIFVSCPAMFSALNIPQLYIPLLRIDMIGAQLQLCFMLTFSMLLCLDRRREALIATACFVLSNFAFTLGSIILGPYYYGYGFAVSALLSCAVGAVFLRQNTDMLEYKTFMLRPR